jgi:hypothetical protein
MKRNIAFLLSLIVALFAMAQDIVNYQVLRFSSPNIKINGKVVKEKMTFQSDAEIEWATEPPVTQILEVKNLSTGMICRYSNRQFKSKQSTSIMDFYLQTNKTSTRDVNASVETLIEGTNKNKFSDKRIALVIGNSDYASLGYLRNAMTDAARMSEELQKLGFDVLEGYECRYEDMCTLLNKFTNYAKGYDVAMIYYSGHGVQNSNVNYMVPIEAKLESVGSLNLCVAAGEFVDNLDRTGCDTKILIFDACRNPKTSWSRSTNAGLAIMEGTPGMTITFSTQNGNVAIDGEGDCSPFAKALFDNMEADASFSDMMRNVVKQTYNATSNAQFPITTGMLLSNFRFNPGGKQLADVKVTKTKSRAADGNTQNGSMVERKQDVAGPIASWNNNNIDIKFGNTARLVGDCAIFTIIMENKTEHTITPRLADAGTKAYDNAGGMQTFGNIYLKFRNQRVGWSQSFTLPEGVPVTMEMVVSPVSSAATMMNYIELDLNNAEGLGDYGYSVLKIKNLPIVK